MLIQCYVAIVCIISIHYIWKWMKSNQTKQENEYMEIKNNILKQYYDSLKQQMDLANRFRHDIANHISIVERLAAAGESPEFKEYKEKLVSVYDGLGRTGICSEPMLEAMICYKERECAEDNIKFDVSLVKFYSGVVSEMDMLNIFYETLNYIINTLRMTNIENKQIRILSKCNAGNLLLWFTYPIEQNEYRKRKRIKRTIQKKLNYIQKILDTYEGMLDTSVTEEGCTIHLLLKNEREFV